MWGLQCVSLELDRVALTEVAKNHSIMATKNVDISFDVVF